MSELVGARLGNFTLVRVVGEGAMGTVYLCEHDRIERRKAVKVLRDEWARDAQLVKRFFNEAMAATACNHDHIITVDDCGTLTHAGKAHHFILMELLEGHDLSVELATVGRFPVERAARIVAYAADAVAAAHARGIVHRDLKPGNLFLARRGGRADYLKVLDFGIARLTAELAPGTRTRTGQIIGTPDYMSPEQSRGLHADARSDVYSLGVVLYRLLAGKLPFAADTFTLLAARIQNEPPPPVDAERKDLPRGIVRAVQRALAKRPEERHATMHDFLRALVAEDAAPEALIPQPSLDVPMPAADSDPPTGPARLAPESPTVMGKRSSLLPYLAAALAALVALALLVELLR